MKLYATTELNESFNHVIHSLKLITEVGVSLSYKTKQMFKI